MLTLHQLNQTLLGLAASVPIMVAGAGSEEEFHVRIEVRGLEPDGHPRAVLVSDGVLGPASNANLASAPDLTPEAFLDLVDSDISDLEVIEQDETQPKLVRDVAARLVGIKVAVRDLKKRAEGLSPSETSLASQGSSSSSPSSDSDGDGIPDEKDDDNFSDLDQPEKPKKA